MNRLSSTVDVSVRIATAVLLLTSVYRPSSAAPAAASAPAADAMRLLQSPEVVPQAIAAASRTKRSGSVDELTSVDKRVGRMASWGRRDSPESAVDELDDNDRDKRIGRMASWGKKSVQGENPWMNEATNKAVRSKWSSGSMSVWGKRGTETADGEHNFPDEDKRNKWSGNSMAVWGKRDDEKRGWENKNMNLWG
jgi:hypothetical protein